jgi:hypothetical protein
LMQCAIQIEKHHPTLVIGQTLLLWIVKAQEPRKQKTGDHRYQIA